MLPWMIGGIIIVSLFAWRILSSAIADDKKRKRARVPSRF
jgi:hypothetical protein